MCSHFTTHPSLTRVFDRSFPPFGSLALSLWGKGSKHLGPSSCMIETDDIGAWTSRAPLELFVLNQTCQRGFHLSNRETDSSSHSSSASQLTLTNNPPSIFKPSVLSILDFVHANLLKPSLPSTTVGSAMETIVLTRHPMRTAAHTPTNEAHILNQLFIALTTSGPNQTGYLSILSPQEPPICPSLLVCRAHPRFHLPEPNLAPNSFESIPYNQTVNKKTRIVQLQMGAPTHPSLLLL